jgi:threonine dehydrogenase-like Zn-dependent dehydrogenase
VQFGTGLLGKEVTVIPATMYGHHHGVREFELAAEMLAAHPDLGDVLVSHRFGLDDASEAFRVSGDRASGAIKVVLEP